MKTSGTIELNNGFWISPNISATNCSGFSALPGGTRTNVFGSIGASGSWWTSTEAANGLHGANRRIFNKSRNVQTGSSIKYYGRSVRCVKD